MDDVVTKPASRLYEDDFYAWTQAQAGLLRAGRVEQADITNILEEIETLGRKEVSELHARLAVLTQHLLKEVYQPEKAGRSWAATIAVQRHAIARHIRENPSLKSKVAQVFREAYDDGRMPAAIETGLPLGTFPVEPPFSLQQALDVMFWPGRPYDDRG